LTAIELTAYLDARLAEVEAALTSILPRSPDCPLVVAEAMQYSLMAGGKRLRPILCLASADAVGGDRSLAMPAACAIELIHTYSLIHDDLPAMDDDVLRRGRPTLHVVAGEGMAILAGDGLLTEAFQVLAREPRTSDPDLVARKLRVIETIAGAAGAVGMVGGQAIDLASVTPDRSGQMPAPLDAEALKTMHSKKTGALIRGSAKATLRDRPLESIRLARLFAVRMDRGRLVVLEVYRRFAPGQVPVRFCRAGQHRSTFRSISTPCTRRTTGALPTG